MAFLLTCLFRFGKLLVVKVILTLHGFGAHMGALLKLFSSDSVGTEFYGGCISDKHVSSFQALDMIRGKNILLLMDSHLEGNFSTEEATVVFDLASQCLQYEPRERPKTKDLVSTLAPLQNKNDASSNNILGF